MASRPAAMSLMPSSAFRRTYELEDIRISRSADGGADGRTVEAYAAVFDVQAEIHDQEGHYYEVIDRAAFNRTLNAARPVGSRATWGVSVFYNHSQTTSGTPSDRFSMPIGVPVDIRPESRGLLTLTRYAETPLGDEVLELIRTGAIQSQSFSGRIMRSTPPRELGRQYSPKAGVLPLVRRIELGLREYGPTPFPAYKTAEIVGVRTVQLDRAAGHAEFVRKTREARRRSGIGAPLPSSTSERIRRILARESS